MKKVDQALQSLNELELDAYPDYKVRIDRIRELGKSLGRDHVLAQQLWSVDNTEAKYLAVLTEEPFRVKEEQIEKMILEVGDQDLADLLAHEVIANTQFSFRKIGEFVDFRKPLVKRVGWLLLYDLAREGKGLSNAEFEKYLPLIEKTIHLEESVVKEAMLQALIAVGSRNIELNKTVLLVAQKISKADPTLEEQLSKLSKPFIQSRLR